MDAIVVDTESVAIECIDYMKKNRVGTVQVLPLDTIISKPPNETLRQLGGSFKLVIDVLTFDER